MDAATLRWVLAAAIPPGNIWWSDEEQADVLVPVVQQLLADECRLATEAVRRDG